MKLKKSNIAVAGTISAICVAWLLMLGWTIYASQDHYADNTISNVTTSLQFFVPALTAALGTICGHWTLPRSQPIFGLEKETSMWIMFWLIWLEVVMTPYLRELYSEKLFMAVNFQLYYFLAHFFWPQDIDINTAKGTLPFWNA